MLEVVEEEEAVVMGKRYGPEVFCSAGVAICCCPSDCFSLVVKYLLTCRSNCFLSFFSRLSHSRFSISSADNGSPEHVWGCELCAGLPGPFLVFSFLRHLARLFWNQTYKCDG